MGVKLQELSEVAVNDLIDFLERYGGEYRIIQDKHTLQWTAYFTVNDKYITLTISRDALELKFTNSVRFESMKIPRSDYFILEVL